MNLPTIILASFCLIIFNHMPKTSPHLQFSIRHQIKGLEITGGTFAVAEE
jgi:hypothetical protein